MINLNEPDAIDVAESTNTGFRSRDERREIKSRRSTTRTPTPRVIASTKTTGSHSNTRDHLGDFGPYGPDQRVERLGGAPLPNQETPEDTSERKVCDSQTENFEVSSQASSTTTSHDHRLDPGYQRSADHLQSSLPRESPVEAFEYETTDAPAHEDTSPCIVMQSATEKATCSADVADNRINGTETPKAESLHTRNTPMASMDRTHSADEMIEPVDCDMIDASAHGNDSYPAQDSSVGSEQPIFLPKKRGRPKGKVSARSQQKTGLKGRKPTKTSELSGPSKPAKVQKKKEDEKQIQTDASVSSRCTRSQKATVFFKLDQQGKPTSYTNQT